MSKSRRRCTVHARKRYATRIDYRRPPTETDRLVLRDERRAVTVPARYAPSLFNAGERRKVGRHWRQRITFRTTATRFFVLRGKSIVTCWRLPLASTAALLVWAMFGIWPDKPKPGPYELEER